MKFFLIILFLLLSINLYSNELTWVDEQIKAIKPPRKGVSTFLVSKLQDPFVAINKTKKKRKRKSSSYKTPGKKKTLASKLVTKKKFTLNAIMNNSALIDNIWYKIGGTVKGYKLTKVDKTFVILTKGKNKLLLSTNSKNQNLKFKNK